mmetsp:Transcript_29853/g.71006  ORF Transcript_29853/g.71006 Transcript_29853/m.71006 type:complete len:240 (-) Transcript_29853:91-810(-)
MSIRRFCSAAARSSCFIFSVSSTSLATWRPSSWMSFSFLKVVLNTSTCPLEAIIDERAISVSIQECPSDAVDPSADMRDMFSFFFPLGSALIERFCAPPSLGRTRRHSLSAVHLERRPRSYIAKRICCFSCSSPDSLNESNVRGTSSMGSMRSVVHAVMKCGDRTSESSAASSTLGAAIGAPAMGSFTFPSSAIAPDKLPSSAAFYNLERGEEQARPGPLQRVGPGFTGGDRRALSPGL